MAATVPLLRTKLFIPRVRAAWVPRPRLTRRLTEAAARPLTLISAPAGFGKTTLLADWLAAEALPVAWVSLDNSDNDPVRFWSYVIVALQTVQADLGGNALGLLEAPQPPAFASVLTLLVNDLASLDQPITLILDDYHLIETQAIHDGLIFLLDHLPPQLRLIIASRADPLLPLARLRAQGDLLELRAGDLRFSQAEAADFLSEVMGLSLSDAAIGALEHQTEGWIAGLQLAGLSLRGRQAVSSFIEAFTGSHRYILDYLTDEVLEQQRSAVKFFLLQTSILNRMCGALCDALTGGSDGQAVLEQLEQANLFIVSLDDARRWYRYHHLFAEVLQARLRQSQPELLLILHRRACDWYETQGLMTEAVQHALAAADMNRMAELIERAWWASVGRGEFNTVYSWLNALPVEIVRARPRLSLAYAWIYSFLEQIESIEPHLLEAEKALALAAIQRPEQLSEIDAIRGEIATLHIEAALSQSDIRGAIELGQQALALLPKDSTLIRGIATLYLGYAQQHGGQIAESEQAYLEAARLGMETDNLLLALKSMANLSNLQMVLGRLGEAAKTSQQILQITLERRRQTWPVAGLAYYSLGKLYYEWNDLDAAASHLRQAIALSQSGSVIGLEIDSGIALAFTLQAQHDSAGADKLMQQIATTIEQRHYPIYAAVASAARASLRLRQGRSEPTGHWAETWDLRPDDTFRRSRLEAGYLTLARVYIAQGQIAAALDLLDSLQQTAEADGRTGSLIEILILLALARQAQADPHQALNTLQRAVQLAEPEGYIRLFVDEGEPMATLLSQARDRGNQSNYISKLWAAFDAEVPVVTVTADKAPTSLQPSPTPLIEPLTERERELLQLVAAGHSNQQIAQDLFLAVGTVKKHLNNIFGKLAAGNRTQAVARARELNLL